MSEGRVDVRRGGLVESTHRVHVAVVDGTGRLRARTGDQEFITWARSTLKPIQAIPVVADGVAEALGWGPPEIALCCASHSGQPMHVERVAAMLASIGLTESSLACGPQAPRYRPAADALREAGKEPGRIHNNCSGKHAGMLGLAKVNGWDTVGYETPDHPVQQRILAEVSQWTGVSRDRIPLATDGCGVMTFALPLRALANAFARLAAASRSGGGAPARVVQAILERPELMAGTDRMCSDLIAATDGRVFAKVGAEGVYCAGVPGAEIGIALKVEDGALRAAQPALLAVLAELDLLSKAEAAELSGYARPKVLNTRAAEVGEIVPTIRLEPIRG